MAGVTKARYAELVECSPRRPPINSDLITGLDGAMRPKTGGYTGYRAKSVAGVGESVFDPDNIPKVDAR